MKQDSLVCRGTEVIPLNLSLYPQVIVSDIGLVLTSDDFNIFVKINGVKHIRSALHHPSTNGCAERAVRTFKAMIKKFAGIKSMPKKFGPVKTRGGERAGIPHIFDKVDLLPIANDREKKKVAQKCKPPQISQKFLLLLLQCTKLMHNYYFM